MENTIYRIDMTDGFDLEFSVIGTNELNPYREIKEIGVCMFKDKKQFDSSLNIDELKSFINYLEECRRYVETFNKNSLPKPEITT